MCCLIQATVSSLNKQHLTDRLANIAPIQPVFATRKFLIMKSRGSGRGTSEKNLSIEYGFPSGTHLREILRIHLMIYLPDCRALKVQLKCLLIGYSMVLDGHHAKRPVP